MEPVSVSQKKTLIFLEENHIEYIPPEYWPPNSPDLNPIENLLGRRAVIQDRVEAGKWKTQKGYERAVFKEWSNVTIGKLGDLTDSMARRIIACIKAKGDTLQFKAVQDKLRFSAPNFNQ